MLGWLTCVVLSSDSSDVCQVPAATQFAGDPVLYAFTLTNTGTVTLRDLRLRQSSGVTSVICQPSLNSTLPVGATMTCVGGRYVTYEDFDLNQTVTRAQFVARNILPLPDNPNMPGDIRRSVLLQNAALPTPPFTRYGDMFLPFGSCWNAEYAGGVPCCSCTGVLDFCTVDAVVVAAAAMLHFVEAASQFIVTCHCVGTQAISCYGTDVNAYLLFTWG